MRHQDERIATAQAAGRRGGVRSALLAGRHMGRDETMSDLKPAGGSFYTEQPCVACSVPTAARFVAPGFVADAACVPLCAACYHNGILWAARQARREVAFRGHHPSEQVRFPVVIISDGPGVSEAMVRPPREGEEPNGYMQGGWVYRGKP